MKDYSVLNEMIKNQKDVIITAYDKGYAQKVEASSEVAYQKGLDDAWDCAKKIVLSEGDGGLTVTELLKIFGTNLHRDVLLNESPSEAISKIKAYEEKKKAEEEEIKVGDEVTFSHEEFPGVVIAKTNNELWVLFPHYDAPQSISCLYDAIKTGRSFPQIAEVFKQLKED